VDERSGHSAIVFGVSLKESKDGWVCSFKRGGRRLFYELIHVPHERIVIRIKSVQSIGEGFNGIDRCGIHDELVLRLIRLLPVDDTFAANHAGFVHS
jgi:hypothetical protein